MSPPPAAFGVRLHPKNPHSVPSTAEMAFSSVSPSSSSSSSAAAASIYSSSSFLSPANFPSSWVSNVSVPAKRVGTLRCISVEAKTAYKTKVSRKANMAKLQAGLFPEIARRRHAHL
ncbi:hypothetical protein MLD38_013431 [Melastoma candidum]|uniref:Uncharacterized protein n=1 Tax=Melastoma candidum TaxID=119954 RepID=A0ACB9RI11_9MYRT|nr:hypothetical protein MLD38_013431 [Melastoma candidum]